MSAVIQKSKEIKSFLSQPMVQSKITELVGKNAASFATSIMQIVNNNNMLSSAEPMSIFNAACMAATLNLPINNNLGFAYIVPFKNNKTRQIEAQFQLGYKGFIQLAQRSGQFSRIAASPVYEGQLINEDPLLGYEFDWSVPKNGEPTGYVAFFKLLNGFTAELYMSKADVLEHAQKYSQSFKQGYGVWKDQFDTMALKTVLKLLLSKQAPLSIEMQKAVLSDQSVIKDVTEEKFEYIDNQADEIDPLAGDQHDPKYNQLIEDAEQAASNGSRAYENFWKSMSPSDRKIIGINEHERLKDIANNTIEADTKEVVDHGTENE